MKTAARIFLLLLVVSIFASLARADCPGGPNVTCITSFTISPGAIPGDNTTTAQGQATAHIATGYNSWELEIRQPSGLGWVCHQPAVHLNPNSGGAGFAGGCAVTGTSVSFELFGLNGGSSPVTVDITGAAAYNNDPGIDTSLTLNPRPGALPPDQDPDGPCPTCGYGGAPINFGNGDTWISQQDYSIPGLGGGLVLGRTWNSLWSLSQPPEQSGIFGDSWRSNFEERIQVLTGGVAKYWKSNGSKVFYAYDGGSGGYVRTAPADDRTTIDYDPITMLWTATQKDGVRRILAIIYIIHQINGMLRR
jgi:hypothetical protein